MNSPCKPHKTIRHPERSVLCGVKDLYNAYLRSFTAKERRFRMTDSKKEV
jgi:hypothetical protein